MRKIVFLFCLTLSITLYAQPKINWGDIQKSNHTGSDYIGVKTENEQNIFMIKQDRIVHEQQVWYLECISKQNKNIVYTKTLLTPITPDKKPIKWNTIIAIGTKLYLFSSYYDNKIGLFNIYASFINTSTGDLQETKLIYSDTVKTKNIPYFHYAFSPDKSKLIICPVPLNLQKNAVKIIDENLQDVWKGILTLPVTLNPLQFYEPVIDNNNNIALYNVNYGNDNLPANQKIIVYTTRTGQGNVLDITVPEAYFLYSETQKIYENNKLYFIGLLCEKNSSGKTAGTLTAFVDLDRQEYLNAGIVIFNKEKTDELESSNIKGEGSFLGLYFIREIFFRPNGSISILAEQEAYDKYTGNYISSLAFCCNLNLKGYINWLTLIPKYQSHLKKEYLSFVSGYDDKNLYLIFNDSYKNANLVHGQSPHCMDNLSNCVTVLVSVDDYGTVNKKAIYSEDEALYLSVKPILCSKLKSNELLLFAEKENAIRLGEITLK